MKVLIIEDEGIAAERLIMLLAKIDPSIEVFDYLDSVRSSVDWLKSHSAPELIFMDIQLSDGLSFEIMEQVEVGSPIIFTTAYDQYAIRAFKTNSIDYLLKPISEEDLVTALNKFKERGQGPKLSAEEIRSLLGSSKKYKERFVIKLGEHLKTVSTEDVEVFYSQNKATYLLAMDAKKYLIDYPLDQVETMVNPELFFRINRAHMVNINSIKDIISYSTSRLKIVLKNYSDAELIVSREKVNQFKSWLDK